MEASTIDRANWRRYAPSNNDRCIVCGRTAAISISLAATPKTKGGAMLARNTLVYCNDHGLMRYGEALVRLQGGVMPPAVSESPPLGTPKRRREIGYDEVSS